MSEIFKIEKKEIIFSLIGVLFLLAWFLYIRNWIAPYLSSIPPFLAMILYSMGLFVGIFFLTSLLNGKSKVHLKVSIITYLVLLGVSIISAPYLVSVTGQISHSVEFWFVGADAGFGSLYQSFLPSSLVWTFTYIISPVLLMFVIPILIGSPKQIKKAFGG